MKRDLVSNLLTGYLPSFLSTEPSYTFNAANNEFYCPLPTWCDSPPTGNGYCAPCVPPSSSPSFSPSLSITPSASVSPSLSSSITPSLSETPSISFSNSISPSQSLSSSLSLTYSPSISPSLSPSLSETLLSPQISSSSPSYSTSSCASASQWISGSGSGSGDGGIEGWVWIAEGGVILILIATFILSLLLFHNYLDRISSLPSHSQSLLSTDQPINNDNDEDQHL